MQATRMNIYDHNYNNRHTHTQTHTRARTVFKIIQWYLIHIMYINCHQLADADDVFPVIHIVIHMYTSCDIYNYDENILTLPMNLTIVVM